MQVRIGPPWIWTSRLVCQNWRQQISLRSSLHSFRDRFFFFVRVCVFSLGTSSYCLVDYFWSLLLSACAGLWSSSFLLFIFFAGQNVRSLKIHPFFSMMNRRLWDSLCPRRIQLMATKVTPPESCRSLFSRRWDIMIQDFLVCFFRLNSEDLFQNVTIGSRYVFSSKCHIML